MLLQFTEHQVKKYFLAMFCQNIVPQKKKKTKKNEIITLTKKVTLTDCMFRLILLIYGRVIKNICQNLCSII